MKDLFAFVDEYGNNSFNFQSQGTHFIVTAIIVSKDNKLQLESDIERIRQKYFQKGEIKSKHVAGGDRRREIILREMVKSHFHVYSVVVDKRKLEGEGFKYKGSFYKFLNGLVYKELYKTYPDLRLAVDEHGRNDFMRGFKKYVALNHQPTLFAGSEFYFMSSPDSVLIQLADFITGTLGRCFDETKKSSESEKFLEMLRPKLASINFFPNENQPLVYQPEKQEQGYNPLIAEFAVNLAHLFIEKKKGKSSSLDTDQINCVKLLLLYFKAYSHKKYVSAKELMKHLNAGRDEEINEHYFRTKVIAKLRDEGIIIASNSRGDKKGYKLPTCEEDLYNFVNHGNSMIVPMLARIKKCRDMIKLATSNELDILDKPQYKELKSLVEN